MVLGVNTFGLGGLLKGTFLQTLGKMKEHGITAVEPCIHFKGKPTTRDILIEIGMKYADQLGGVWTPEEARGKLDLFRSQGFLIEGAHLFIGEMTEPMVEATVAFAKENGLKYYALSVMTDRLDKAAKQIPLLRRAVRIYHENGIHFLLHNHDMDLKETEGLCVLDFLLENVPDLELELDIGWATYAGRDAIALIEKYREKLRVLHFKDMLPDEGRKTHRFCAVGEGMIPLAAALEKAPGLDLFQAGMVIDQDGSDGDMMEDVLTGVANIQKNAPKE